MSQSCLAHFGKLSNGTGAQGLDCTTHTTLYNEAKVHMPTPNGTPTDRLLAPGQSGSSPFSRKRYGSAT